jgi:hypothetical protein
MAEGVPEYDVPVTQNTPPQVHKLSAKLRPAHKTQINACKGEAPCAATSSNQLPSLPTRRPKQTQQVPAKLVALVKVSTGIVHE